LAKATQRGADALIVDLEDAVPATGKDEARAIVAGWLPTLDDTTVEIWVRVNPGTLGLIDVAAVAGPNVRGVMVAKTESAAELAAVGAALADAERAQGLPDGSIGLVPLLESAAALLAAQEIAQVPRVVRLQVGEADLAADLGFSPSPDESEWSAIRSQTVVISTAAGISAPVAPVSTNFRDLEAYAESTRALARRGFVGRACIHPAQIAVANEIFTPTDEEVGRARELVRLFDEAIAQGVGVIVGPDGRMIDEAVVRQSRRIIGLAR
jgi:citrate lyase subunit beta/citryl-CoA lyase